MIVLSHSGQVYADKTRENQRLTCADSTKRAIEGLHAAELAGELRKGIAPKFLYKAWAAGNSKFPQCNFGISTSVMNRVLSLRHQPEFDFNLFLKTRLSEDQLKKIGHAMSRMHEKYGIKVVFRGDPHTQSSTVVEPERLQRLWLDVKDTTLQAFVKWGFVNQRRLPMVDRRSNSIHVEDWNAVSLSDPKDVEAKQWMLTQVADILDNHPEILEFSIEYKKAFGEWAAQYQQVVPYMRMNASEVPANIDRAEVRRAHSQLELLRNSAADFARQLVNNELRQRDINGILQGQRVDEFLDVLWGAGD